MARPKTVVAPSQSPAGPSPAGVPKACPFFISCPRNVESMLAEELEELGLAGARVRRLGVAVELTQSQVYRAVYGSRLASRVLRPLSTFPCRSPDELYERARRMDWSLVLSPDRTFMVTAAVSGPELTHSRYAAQRLKDAVVDKLRDRFGRRPSVDRDNPDIRLDLLVHAGRATISLYYSAGPLNRRGYRVQSVTAPLKENLAAALVRFSGWDGSRSLADPFCGSGTLLVEAAMRLTRTPAGHFRPVQGFERLLDFSPDSWEKVKAEMDTGIERLPPGLIYGWDSSPKSLEAARCNFRATPFGDLVRLGQSDFRAVGKKLANAWVISNPPYGKRLGGGGDAELRGLYADLGRVLRVLAGGSRAVLVLPGPDWADLPGLAKGRRLFLDNGAMEVCVQEFLIPEGT